VHRIETLYLSRRADAEQLLTLQRAAYRVEADLIGFDGIPPLHETLEELTRQPLQWIGIRINGEIVAALAFAINVGHVDIDRLVVDPAHFGQGFGSALAEELLDHPRVTVSTGTGNFPARRLYEKLGFRVIGERKIAPGVSVTRYERLAPLG
jgi:ribosomal protein S18 acetylase RimI-like enzyme